LQFYILVKSKKQEFFQNIFHLLLNFIIGFVDDIIFNFKNIYDQINILNYFNNLDKNLKFTIELEKEIKLSFLDVLIFKNEENFETTWFRKNSYTFRYIPWHSIDSKMYKIRLIYTMVNRLSKICSTQKVNNEDLKLLTESFVASGYPQLILQEH
jgi:hypothetical protein